MTPKTIGETPALRDEILADGQAVLDARNAPPGCKHLRVLRDEGKMQLPPIMAAQHPKGIYLATCIHGCGTTKSARVFDEERERPQFGQA